MSARLINPIMEYVVEFEGISGIQPGSAEYGEFKGCIRCKHIDLTIDQGKVINTPTGNGVVITALSIEVSDDEESQANLTAISNVCTVSGSTSPATTIKLKRMACVRRDSTGKAYTDWLLSNTAGVNAQLLTQGNKQAGDKNISADILITQADLAEAANLTYVNSKMDDKDKSKFVSANQALPAYMWTTAGKVTSS